MPTAAASTRDTTRLTADHRYSRPSRSPHIVPTGVMVELQADGSTTLCQLGHLVTDSSQRYKRYGYACPRFLIQRALDNVLAHHAHHHGPGTGHLYPVYAQVAMRNAEDYAAWDAWQRRDR